jgi:hypothetical protein
VRSRFIPCERESVRPLVLGANGLKNKGKGYLPARIDLEILNGLGFVIKDLKNGEQFCN